MIIGFNLDGTIAGEDFDERVWHEEIPKLYSNKEDISIDRAKEHCYSEYYKEKFMFSNPRWTDLEYWFEHFSLEESWETLLDNMKDNIYLFPETMEVLDSLKEEKLVIISNAHPHFLNIKLKAEGLTQYFDKVFSTEEYSGKTTEFYKKVCDELGIAPKELYFVGNDYEEDYKNAKAAGINAYFLDRKNKRSGPEVVHSLKEFKKIIS